MKGRGWGEGEKQDCREIEKSNYNTDLTKPQET